MMYRPVPYGPEDVKFERCAEEAGQERVYLASFQHPNSGPGKYIYLTREGATFLRDELVELFGPPKGCLECAYEIPPNEDSY